MPEDPVQPISTDESARPLEAGIGLCLSGGGYRAMLLFRARGTKPFQVHLTYPIDEIDAERRHATKNWSAAKHSLAAFFKKTKLAKGQEIHIVDEKEPHVIDLLDPLGY